MISVKQKITCSLFSFCKMKDKMPGASSLPVIKNFSRLLFQLKLKNEIDFFSPFYFISSFAFCLVFCFLNSLPPLPPSLVVWLCCVVVLFPIFVVVGRSSIDHFHLLIYLPRFRIAAIAIDQYSFPFFCHLHNRRCWNARLTTKCFNQRPNGNEQPEEAENKPKPNKNKSNIIGRNKNQNQQQPESAIESISGRERERKSEIWNWRGFGTFFHQHLRSRVSFFWTFFGSIFR